MRARVIFTRLGNRIYPDIISRAKICVLYRYRYEIALHIRWVKEKLTHYVHIMYKIRRLHIAVKFCVYTTPKNSWRIFCVFIYTTRLYNSSLIACTKTPTRHPTYRHFDYIRKYRHDGLVNLYIYLLHIYIFYFFNFFLPHCSR